MIFIGYQADASDWSILKRSKTNKKFAICELGVAFSQFKELPIWDHVFAPKEFFHEVLEKQFAKVIVKFIKVDATNQMIEKPTITLNRVSPTHLPDFVKIFEFRKNFMVFRLTVL